jgi:hypothetical protein
MMSRRQRYTALTFLFAILCSSELLAQEPQDVSMVQLISNPEKFNGKVVRVIGFLRIEFEGNVLYMHREDYDYAILGNGVWVDLPEFSLKNKDRVNLKYVILVGQFSSKDRGHMGMWSGSFNNVQRLERWREIRNAAKKTN